MRRLLAAATIACAAPALAATWTLDPAHSSVQFSVRHMMVSNVRGEFAKVAGTVQGDETKPTEAVIDGHHRRGQHRHPRGEARRAPEERRLPRRREASDDHLQVEADRAGGRRQVQGDRRPHAARRHQGGRARRVRRHPAHQGPVRQDARRRDARPRRSTARTSASTGARRWTTAASSWATRSRSPSTSRRPAVSDDRTPILVGAGQLTQRDVEPVAALEPLAMMEAVARRAADDAGAGPALLGRVDSLAVVNIFCWPYANAPRLLAERLGAATRREELYTTVGGNTPQWLVNETAAEIAAGRVRLALLAGAEAVRTVLRAPQGARTSSTGRAAATAARTVIGDAARRHERARGGARVSCCRRRSTRSSRTRCAPARAGRSPSTSACWARSAPGCRRWRRRTRTPGSARRARPTRSPRSRRRTA